MCAVEARLTLSQSVSERGWGGRDEYEWQGLSVNLELPGLAGLPSQRLQYPPVSAPSPGITTMSGFVGGCWDLNSNSPACTAGPLLVLFPFP